METCRYSARMELLCSQSARSAIYLSQDIMFSAQPVLPENASKQRLRCHHHTQALDEGLDRSLSPILLLHLRCNSPWRDAQLIIHGPVALAVLKPCCVKNKIHHAMPMLRKICMHRSQKSLELVDAFNSAEELHPCCIAHCEVKPERCCRDCSADSLQ